MREAFILCCIYVGVNSKPPIEYRAKLLYFFLWYDKNGICSLATMARRRKQTIAFASHCTSTKSIETYDLASCVLLPQLLLFYLLIT